MITSSTQSRHMVRFAPQPFREGQRAVLAVHDAAGAYPVGRKGLGVAVHLPSAPDAGRS